MVKPEWGNKRYCHKCHNKYYDMQKDPITCPSCGTAFQAEFLKSRDDYRNTSKDDLDLDTDVDVEKDDFEDEAGDDDDVVVDTDISKDEESED